MFWIEALKRILARHEGIPRVSLKEAWDDKWCGENSAVARAPITFCSIFGIELRSLLRFSVQ
jgi:hypothetical protein